MAADLWHLEIQRALKYIEKLVDAILEADETNYRCDLRIHSKGETCPNRRNIVLPDPEEGNPNPEEV